MRQFCTAVAVLFLCHLLLGQADTYAVSRLNGKMQVETVASSFSFPATDAADSTNITVAFIEYNATMNETGWDVVTVTANPAVLNSNVSLAYYGAGYLEGYVTAVSIWNNFVNVGVNEFASDPSQSAERDFVDRQFKFVEDLVQNGVDAATAAAAGLPTDGSYTKTFAKLYSQVQGLSDGYNAFIVNFPTIAAANGLTSLSFKDMYYNNLQSEWWDIQEHVEQTKPHAHRRQVSEGLKKRRQLQDKMHCSALIKSLPDMSDLYVSHSTWGGFNTMLRQYKTYNFEISLSMSSYPGYVSSTDDWYMTSNGLVIQETTNGVFNLTLYRDYFSSSTVPEWMRVMAATYLATTAKEWTQIFVYLNSGSYNNQWMAVDMKLFTPGDSIADLPDNLVWISETLPGFYQMADVTEVIRQQGYWASYNRPYFQEIFQLSGTAYRQANFGSFFSYSKYARAEIFKRNQSMVTDLESMKRLMRYNDFQNDPLSDIPNCTGTIYNNTCRPQRSALLTISARGDLDPIQNVSEMGPLAQFGHGVGLQNMAGIDCKLATWKGLMKGGAPIGWVVSGPSWDQQPKFVWSTAPSALKEGLSWRGQPDQQAFLWQSYAAKWIHFVAVPLVDPPYPRVIVPAIIGGVLLCICGAVAVFIIMINRLPESEGESAHLLKKVSP
jgi:hypothetical protein